MNQHRAAGLVILLLCALGTGWAQGDPGPQTSSSGTDSGAAPAYGEDNSQSSISQNPPISGLDQPSLESRVLTHSFLLPGIHASQSLDSNVANDVGNTSLHGVTRLLGSLALLKLSGRSETGLDYIGGTAIYSNRAVGATQVQELDAIQRFFWRTGQLALRDSVSYLTQGSFGYGSFGGAGAFGEVGGVGGAVPGIGNFFGLGQLGSLGQVPHISNLTVLDVTEGLSPRSSVTLAGSYGLVHYTGTTGLIDSQQVTAQGAYNYRFTRKDQFAVLYGHQSFHYPLAVGSHFNTDLLNVLYGHRISGRMDLVVGGGPQFTHIISVFGTTTTTLSASGRATLQYHFPRTTVALAYHHYNTSGSGFFAGAKTDVGRIQVARPLSRLWSVRMDVGYAHNTQLAVSLLGNLAKSFGNLYGAAAVRRQMGRSLDAYLTYQYSDLSLDSSFCASGTPCNRMSQRHVLAVGLDWHPRPIRLD